MEQEIKQLTEAFAARRFELIKQGLASADSSSLFIADCKNAFEEMKKVVMYRPSGKKSKEETAEKMIYLASWAAEILISTSQSSIDIDIQSIPNNPISIIDAAQALAIRKCQELGI